MAELEAIAEALRRQRKDLQDLKDSTFSRRAAAADLVSKIEELNRRAEDTRRRFQASVTESGTPRKK
jgi:hypothetical protein